MQKHALKGTCLGNCRGQTCNLRTVLQYLLAGLLLYVLATLASDNYVRIWNSEFSLTVKSQGQYITFSNPKNFQPHKALVNLQPFRRTDSILHTPLDLTTGLVKHPHATLHLKGCALIHTCAHNVNISTTWMIWGRHSLLLKGTRF